MLKVIMLSLVLLVANNAIAASTSSSIKMQHCNSIRDIAAQLMDLRQKDVELSKVLNVEGPEVFARLALAAWDEPVFSSEDYKEKAVKEFSHKFSKDCYKAIYE